MDEFKREFRAGDVFGALDALIRTQERMMSALTDLQAAVAAAVAEIQKLAAATAPVTVNGTADADIEAQVSALNAAVAAAQAPAAPVTPAAPVEGAPAAS